MKHRIGHYLLKFKYIIALAVFFVMTGFVGETSWVNRLKCKEDIARLENEIAEQRRQFKADSVQLLKMKSDPEMIRQVAHERYFMKTSDEDVYIIYDK